MTQLLDHPQGEYLKVCLVCIFDNTLDAEFEYDLRIMKEKFMKFMQKHNLRMKPKVHLLGKCVPKLYTVQEFYLGLLLHSPHALFDIFEKGFKVNGERNPVVRERLVNAVLDHNLCHL